MDIIITDCLCAWKLINSEYVSYLQHAGYDEPSIDHNVEQYFVKWFEDYVSINAFHWYMSYYQVETIFYK